MALSILEIRRKTVKRPGRILQKRKAVEKIKDCKNAKHRTNMDKRIMTTRHVAATDGEVAIGSLLSDDVLSNAASDYV